MTIKDIITSGADVQIVCSAKDLRDAILSIFDRNQKNQAQVQVNDEGIGLVSADEVCKIVGVKKPTLWRWSKIGYLVPVKVGRKNFYQKSDLDALSGKKGVSDEV